MKKTIKYCSLLLLLFFFSCEKKVNLFNSNQNIDTVINVIQNQVDSDISEKKLDFLIQNVLSLKNDSTKALLLNDIAKKYLVSNSYNNFLKVSKVLLKNSIETKDTLNIANGYKNLGTYFVKLNQNDSAFYYFNKADLIYLSINEIQKASTVKVKKAKIQYYKNDFLGCEATILKVLRQFSANKDYINLNICYSLIGMSKIEVNEVDEGIESLNKALKFARYFEKNDDLLFYEKNNLGLAYIKKQDYSNALFYFKQVSNKNVRDFNLDIYLSAKQYIAYCNFKLNIKQDFEKSFNEVIKEAKSNNLSYVLPTLQLSEYYNSINNYRKAKEKAIEAFEISIKEKLYRYKLQALKQLSEVFPEKAKYYSDEYVKLKDSIADVDKKTSNTFARIEYRVDELTDKNVALEQKNKNLVLYFLLIGIIGLMLYFNSWSRAKKREMILIQANNEANENAYRLMLNEQQQLEEVKEQEQKRISRDIHDAVLGRLFGIRMNLDFLNTKNENETIEKRKSYILELQEIENNLRQISHQLNDEKKEIMNNFKMMLDKLVIQQESLQLSEINYKILTEIPWEKITDEQKINLYRIIQESFQNINKYAKAKFINFELSFDEPIFQISIKDDGLGFNTKKKSKGIGLNNMKERAKLIGAAFEIESNIDQGTQTTIKLNLENTKIKKNEIT